MAPTAAMLILSHNSKSSPSTPSVPCAAASSGVGMSIMKWVSEHNPISFNPRPDHKRESCMEIGHDTHAALEKGFQEALELSCW